MKNKTVQLTPFTIVLFLAAGLMAFSGCQTTRGGNTGKFQNYPFTPVETEWIRNGEPLLFEEEEWYPQDETESLKDTEVYIIGEHRGIQFFVDKVDVRPFDRIYTKFGHNKFRYFEKRVK